MLEEMMKVLVAIHSELVKIKGILEENQFRVNHYYHYNFDPPSPSVTWEWSDGWDDCGTDGTHISPNPTITGHNEK